jgi:hypothetical protein
MSAIHTKTARQKALCGNHSYSNMSWPSQRILNSADTETKEDTREKSKEIKEQEKIEAFVKKLLLRMRLRRWALIPRNIDEALARNSLCSMLDIAFEDLMPLLLACELVEYEKKREGYNNLYRVNSKKWHSFMAKQRKATLYFMTHRPRDENTNKRISACHFVSNGKPGDQKPKPIYLSKIQNLDAPCTAAVVLRPAKHGENTRQMVKEIGSKVAKKKEDNEYEKKRCAAAMYDAREPLNREETDIQESSPDLPRLCNKLLKGSTDTDIYASRLRLRDASFEIIKEKVRSILVDPTAHMMAPSTELPLDEDAIRRICGIAIGFGALDETRTEDQQGMIITGAVLLEQGQACAIDLPPKSKGFRHDDDTSHKESKDDADAFSEKQQNTQKQTLEEAIKVLNAELESKMAEKHKDEMHFAWALDFNRRTDGKRPCRFTGEPKIEIVSRK